MSFGRLWLLGRGFGRLGGGVGGVEQPASGETLPHFTVMFF